MRSVPDEVRRGDVTRRYRLLSSLIHTARRSGCSASFAGSGGRASSASCRSSFPNGYRPAATWSWPWGTRGSWTRWSGGRWPSVFAGGTTNDEACVPGGMADSDNAWPAGLPALLPGGELKLPPQEYKPAPPAKVPERVAAGLRFLLRGAHLFFRRGFPFLFLLAPGFAVFPRTGTFLSCRSAACAAARRATGRRRGEQET